jgi:hypothetical protein
MLLFNETSLYYFDLSTQAAETLKPTGLIENWATAESRSQPTFPVLLKTKASALASSKLKSSSTALTKFSDASRAQSSGVTSVNNKSTKASGGLDKPQAGAVLPTFELNDGAVSGGLFDDDEEAEREAALSSPIKGHQRLTHQVRFFAISVACS